MTIGRDLNTVARLRIDEHVAALAALLARESTHREFVDGVSDPAVEEDD